MKTKGDYLQNEIFEWNNEISALIDTLLYCSALINKYSKILHHKHTSDLKKSCSHIFPTKRISTTPFTILNSKENLSYQLPFWSGDTAHHTNYILFYVVSADKNSRIKSHRRKNVQKILFPIYHTTRSLTSVSNVVLFGSFSQIINAHYLRTQCHPV